jgi:hypothetical protein
MSIRREFICLSARPQRDKNAIQRIEAGKRFVTDIELKQFAAYFRVSTDDLLEE